MIIKIATGKDGNKVQWTPLYAAAIRNRLRQDMNLSDVKDMAAARANLGIDSNFRSVFEGFQSEIQGYINQQFLEKEAAMAGDYAELIDSVTAIRLRLSTCENALTSMLEEKGDPISLNNYLHYVSAQPLFPTNPQIGELYYIQDALWVYLGGDIEWVQLSGTVASGGGSGSIPGGGGSTIYPPDDPTTKYDNDKVPDMPEVFPTLSSIDQCRYRLIFPLETGDIMQEAFKISAYNPTEARDHYVKGRFFIKDGIPTLYLPFEFSIVNNDHAIAQWIGPPEGISKDLVDVSDTLNISYVTAAEATAKYQGIRINYNILDDIKREWRLSSIQGMQLILEYSYAQGLAVGSNVNTKIYRFVPETDNPITGAGITLPKTDMWKMWVDNDDELALSKSNNITASDSQNISYIVNGQYPVQWNQGLAVNVDSADPSFSSYSILSDPVVKTGETASIPLIYRKFGDNMPVNLAIATWTERTLKVDGDDIKPLTDDSEPPFKEPNPLGTLVQGLDPAVEDDETLVTLEFEIFSHKQENQVPPVQEQVNVPVNTNQEYQWGTNAYSDYISLYLPADFTTKLKGTDTEINFTPIDSDNDFPVGVFLLPSEYGKLYLNWKLYDTTFPGKEVALREIRYIQLTDCDDATAINPFTYVYRVTDDNSQVVIAIHKKLINEYVNDLPCDLTDLDFKANGDYKYTDTGYGTHQQNKRLILQWKVQRKSGGHPYYYEKHIWQHEDKNLARVTACFDAIAYKGSTGYDKVQIPLSTENKINDGTSGYSQIAVSNGSTTLQFKTSVSQVNVSADVSDVTNKVRTISYSRFTRFSDPEDVFIKLSYNKLLDHFAHPAEVPAPTPSPSDGTVIGTDLEFDNGFPDLFDICKYIQPAGTYKFIFTLETKTAYLQDGLNAYHISKHNSTRAPATGATGTEGYQTHQQQMSGHFMYNSRSTATLNDWTGATLFLPDSFFDKTLFQEMQVSIRAPENRKYTGVKSNTLTKFFSYMDKPIWLRPLEDPDCPEPDPTIYYVNGNTNVGKAGKTVDLTKHHLYWSNTYEKIKRSTNKSVGQLTCRDGYKVISVPQTILDSITWMRVDETAYARLDYNQESDIPKYCMASDNLEGLQLILTYTFSKDNLGLTDEQWKSVKYKTVTVRNLPLQLIGKKWETTPLSMPNNFAFGSYGVKTSGKIVSDFSQLNNISPFVVVPKDLTEFTTLFQNRFYGRGYLMIGTDYNWLWLGDTNGLVNLVQNPSTSISIDNGITLNNVGANPTNVIMTNRSSYASQWFDIGSNQRYPDKCDTSNIYINCYRPASNTIMVIYESD